MKKILLLAAVLMFSLTAYAQTGGSFDVARGYAVMTGDGNFNDQNVDCLDQVNAEQSSADVFADNLDPPVKIQSCDVAVTFARPLDLHNTEPDLTTFIFDTSDGAIKPGGLLKIKPG